MVIEDALKENAGVGVYISVKQCKKCGAFLVKKRKISSMRKRTWREANTFKA